MSFTPTLFFEGTAEAALDFYRIAFGGEIAITRFAGSPVAGGLPISWNE